MDDATSGSSGLRPQLLAGWHTFGLAVADLDADGDLDIAVPNRATSDVVIVINRDRGRPGLGPRCPVGDELFTLIAAARMATAASTTTSTWIWKT